jgi:uncharacterized protein HemY
MRKRSARFSGFWGKLAVSLSVAALSVVLFTFSLVILAVFLALGLVAWVWLMWRTRGVRRQMREKREEAMHRGANPAGGSVIEGEYSEVTRVVREITEASSRRKP